MRAGFKGALSFIRNGNKIKIGGSFKEVLEQFEDLNTHLRKDWETDISEWLNDEIADRVQLPNKRKIMPEDVIANFEKLSLFQLFKPLTL